VPCAPIIIDQPACPNCHTVYIPRSPNNNTAYFYTPHTTEFCETPTYLNLGVAYQRSFDDRSIATCLFGSPILLFQGSQIVDRDDDAIIADNIGLSPFFNGTISFCPRIENVNVHASLFYAADRFLTGLYGTIELTASQQRRTLNAGETEDKESLTTAFPVGYMAGGSQPVAALTSIKEALQGNSDVGDLKAPRKFGKFCFGQQTEHGIAGATVTIGYDCWRDMSSSFGIFFRYSAPVGTKPNPRFVFSPVIGMGKHHAVGGGVTMHSEVWHKDGNQSLVVALDGYVTTLFNNNQLRSFDLRHKGCFSRYMLLKQLIAPTSSLTNTVAALNSANGPGYSYAGTIIAAIDATTRNVQVKIAAQGDATLRCVYTNSSSCGIWELSAGYNIYGQTEEKICLEPCVNGLTYGVKGGTGVATYIYNTTGATPNKLTNGNTTTPDGLAQNSTAQTSTITTNGPVDGKPMGGLAFDGTTVGVDWANALNGGQPANAVTSGTNTNTLTLSRLSNPAVAITDADLKLCTGTAPSQLAHKGFIQLAYTFDCTLNPSITGGFEAEGSGNCFAYKQWGLWLRGGINF